MPVGIHKLSTNTGDYMRTGRLAALESAGGWELLYTAPKGEHGPITIRVVSNDSSIDTFSLAHVPFGNEGNKAREAEDLIYGPRGVTNVPVVAELEVAGLDDVWLYTEEGGILVASVHTQNRNTNQVQGGSS